MLTHMTFFVVKMLNYFPAKGGISMQFSPKMIMSGQTLNYKQCSLPFGTYCQVHEEDRPRNSLAARTQGALSLGPSLNRQGGQLIFSLQSGRVLLQRLYTILPTPASVINCVNELAADQPHLLTFTDCDGNKFTDNDVEENMTKTPHEIPGVIGDTAQIPGVEMEVKDMEVNEELEMNDPTTTPITPPAAATSKATAVDTTLEPIDFEPIESGNYESELTEMEQLRSSPAKRKPAKPDKPITEGTRKSSRVKQKVQSYLPSIKGKMYGYSAAQIQNIEHDS
jgi:hypothetical protein